MATIVDKAAGHGGAVIYFVNTNVTNFGLSGPNFQSFQLVLTYGNNQTITYHGVIPGNANFSPNVVLLSDDHGGTRLIISGDTSTADAQSSMDVIGVQHQIEHASA